MEMVLGFAVLLVCLFLGIRHGGDWAGCYQRHRPYAVYFCISLQAGHTTHRRHAHYLGRCNLRGVFADFRRSHGHAEVCGKISPQ